MKLRRLPVIALVWSLMTAGCDWMPGRPVPGERAKRLGELDEFSQLYRQNCAGCHGADGRDGMAQPLADPLYQAIATDQSLREAIAGGRPGTAMPAFGGNAGGSLSGAQIELLVAGMRSHWARPDDFKNVELPPHSLQAAKAGGSGPGDPQRGAAVYQKYCAQCHGEGGRGSRRAGSIVDPNFLALVSDQSLRTTVISGRPDLGKPDWRSNLAGQSMTPQEISDVVAWLSSLR